jgi:hypothetical protein
VNDVYVSMIYLTTFSLAQYVRQITVCFLLSVEGHGKISGCPHEVDKIYALLGYEYITTHSTNSLKSFGKNLLVPSSRVKSFLKKGPIDFSRNFVDGLKLYAA